MEIKFNFDENGKLIGCNIDTSAEDINLSSEHFKAAISEVMAAKKMEIEKEIKISELEVQQRIKNSELEAQQKIKDSELKFQKFNNILNATIESLKYGINEFTNLYNESNNNLNNNNSTYNYDPKDQNLIK